jgi:hypothetical protein
MEDKSKKIKFQGSTFCNMPLWHKQKFPIIKFLQFECNFLRQIGVSIKDKSFDAVSCTLGLLWRQVNAPMSAFRIVFLDQMQHQKMSGPLKYSLSGVVNVSPPKISVLYANWNKKNENISMIRVTQRNFISRKNFEHILARSMKCWSWTTLPLAPVDALRWRRRYTFDWRLTETNSGSPQAKTTWVRRNRPADFQCTLQCEKWIKITHHSM